MQQVIHAMPFLRGQTKKEKEYRNKLENRESRLLPNSLIITGHSLGSLYHLSSSRFFIESSFHYKALAFT